jgi:hypothetical protein
VVGIYSIDAPENVTLVMRVCLASRNAASESEFETGTSYTTLEYERMSSCCFCFVLENNYGPAEDPEG